VLGAVWMVVMGILRLELDGRWKMKRRLSTSSQATASRRGVQRQIQGPACEAIECESEMLPVGKVFTEKLFVRIALDTRVQ